MNLAGAGRVAGRWAARLALLLVAAWGGLFLWFLPQVAQGWRITLLLPWLALAGLALRRWRRGLRFATAPVLFGVAGIVLVCVFFSLQPQPRRDWADDVAHQPRARIAGNLLTLYEVRNFHWRSEQDYTVRWETRQYDLDTLATADLAVSYWMGPAIGHTLVSFGFDDGRQLVFSLEIRKERGEAFSALAGFFRNYEQVMVAADERDILRVRTNVRGEDLYLYRLNLSRATLRSLLLGYLQDAQRLRAQPAFYNTLTGNCTTVPFRLVRAIDPGLPLDYRLLLSGYLPNYAYDQHGLLPGHAFQALHDAGRVTARARAAGDAADFSTRIRIGMPTKAAESR
ncbi:MAG: DUF4105 domain-containing protein [Pseudoxanthomonas sp.]